MSLCSYLSVLWGCKCSAQHPDSLRGTAEPSSEPFPSWPSPALLHWITSSPGLVVHCPEDLGVLFLCLTATLFLSFRTWRLAVKRERFSTDHSLWFWPFLSAGLSEQLLESAQCTVLCGSSFILLLSLLIWRIFFFKTKSYWETQILMI